MSQSNHQRVHDETSIDISREPSDTDNYVTSTDIPEGGQLPTSSESMQIRTEGNSTNENYNDENDDDDDITEIGIEMDTSSQYGDYQFPDDLLPYMSEGMRFADDRRRETLVAELQRMQKANFIHFAVLFLVPTAMIILVIWTALSNNGNCDEDIVGCAAEPRRFVHAFTSRCLCTAFEAAAE